MPPPFFGLDCAIETVRDLAPWIAQQRQSFCPFEEQSQPHQPSLITSLIYRNAKFCLCALSSISGSSCWNGGNPPGIILLCKFGDCKISSKISEFERKRILPPNSPYFIARDLTQEVQAMPFATDAAGKMLDLKGPDPRPPRIPHTFLHSSSWRPPSPPPPPPLRLCLLHSSRLYIRWWRTVVTSSQF